MRRGMRSASCQGTRQYVIGDWTITERNLTPIGASLELDLDMEKDASAGYINRARAAAGERWPLGGTKKLTRNTLSR
jgi:hypothetical protein